MNSLFEVHKLNEAGLKKATAIASSFNELLDEITEYCLPPGATDSRHFALVKTHLEQACFYAKKAMASQAENQL